MIRIPFDQLLAALVTVLQRHGFCPSSAQLCAQLFAETTCDGVYTHGVQRFPRFIATIQNGSVRVDAKPQKQSGFGAFERWNGNCGPGNLNAHFSMNRALELSRAHGIGCVALGNTNHWMRGGSYGWQAAAAGFIGICWTNTMPNLPPWGGTEPLIGNNPLVIAVPRLKGPVVLDMAISQFSYGTLESHRINGKQLPVEGGFDAQGNLTRDPAAIEHSRRPLPIGYWKGSGLSMVLDMVAAMTALGRATHQISTDPLLETGLSQLFLAINPASLGESSASAQIVDEIVDSLHSNQPSVGNSSIRYPGEQTLRIRNENLQLGIPVEPETWLQIQKMT